jgi:hypothetical protein
MKTIAVVTVLGVLPFENTKGRKQRRNNARKIDASTIVVV